jgi:GAF domain-containing protein
LKETPFPELLDQATHCVAEGLEAEFAKILKYLPEENRFLVCAGVGWGPGVVGSATAGADTASPAGYALKTGKAVISNHLGIEERFRTPELLMQYGIRRAMNVILAGDGTPFGLLEVDSRSEGESERHCVPARDCQHPWHGDRTSTHRKQIFSRRLNDKKCSRRRSITASTTACKSSRPCCAYSLLALKATMFATSFFRLEAA